MREEVGTAEVVVLAVASVSMMDGGGVWVDGGEGRLEEGGVRLVVFHYHDRPGGVRQVISRGLPGLAARLGGVREVVVLLGEITDSRWARELQTALGAIPLRVVRHGELGYASGGPPDVSKEAREVVMRELSESEVVLWAHNLSVGRNLPLLLNLPAWCAEAGAALWLHHHDWWWDGRWARWADWQAAGVTELEEALELTLPTGRHIQHWCINSRDLPWVQCRAGAAAVWVGNPLPEGAPPDESETAAAREWLETLTGGRQVWLAPVRALRRKNLAEAIYLAQHQTVPTCIVTTGGASSPAEAAGWHDLCQAALQHQWPLVPAVLDAKAESLSLFKGNMPPRIAALFAACDAVVMPSLQEGFGLPYLEAAAYGKPLLARALPNATANLSRLGCTLTETYRSLPVARGAFDLEAESARRFDRWQRLRGALPDEVRDALLDWNLEATLDFGELTLEAQLEVLRSKAAPQAQLPVPQMPAWPQAARRDGWLDRFFALPMGFKPLPDSASENQTHPRTSSLMPEVLRRFAHWQRHPLLWP